MDEAEQFVSRSNPESRYKSRRFRWRPGEIAAADSEDLVDLDRQTLARRLARDLAQGHFELHYQPIVDMRNGRAAGFESLIRLHDRDDGIVPASEFIPFVEENRLIDQLDEWVLGRACETARAWSEKRGRREPFLTVNVSRHSLADEGFGRRAAATIRDSGVDPSQLRIEITETEIVEQKKVLRSNVERIAETGVPIWIDDFGVGASSIRCLQTLPVTGVKIDRVFVSEGAGGRLRDAEILEAVVELGKSLGMQLVAEGVETVDELARVSATGCRYVQGFLFSRSVGPERVEGFFDESLMPAAAGGTAPSDQPVYS